MDRKSLSIIFREGMDLKLINDILKALNQVVDEYFIIINPYLKFYSNISLSWDYIINFANIKRFGITIMLMSDLEKKSNLNNILNTLKNIGCIFDKFRDPIEVNTFISICIG